MKKKSQLPLRPKPPQLRANLRLTKTPESDEERDTYNLYEDDDIKGLRSEALAGMQQEATKIPS